MLADAEVEKALDILLTVSREIDNEEVMDYITILKNRYEGTQKAEILTGERDSVSNAKIVQSLLVTIRKQITPKFPANIPIDSQISKTLEEIGDSEQSITQIWKEKKLIFSSGIIVLVVLLLIMMGVNAIIMIVLAVILIGVLAKLEAD